MPHNAVQRLKIRRIENNQSKILFDTVAIEKGITVKVVAHGEFRFLCTPRDLKALITGFLFTQKLITAARDIKSQRRFGNIITINLREKKTKNIPKKINPPRKIVATQIFQFMQELHHRQKIFPLTGAAHAALIFNAQGKVIAFAEDVARHNAVDKAIGKCLLKNGEGDMYGIALSSRVAYELVKKIARTPIKLIIAVSAPTSLAIQIAKKCGINLCGFVRGERMNGYTNF